MNVTDRKLEANRRNAQKSTGPRTEMGKQRAKMNSLKHGFFSKAVHFESADEEADYCRIKEGIEKSLSAVGTVEELEVERITLLAWNEKRIIRLIQQQLSQYETSRMDPQLQQFIAESHLPEVCIPGLPESGEQSSSCSPWDVRELVATVGNDQNEYRRSEDCLDGESTKKGDLDANREISRVHVEVRLGQALGTLQAQLASIEKSYERAVKRLQCFQQLRHSRLLKESI